MSGRRVCACGASYHVRYNPPIKTDVCDKCGDALYIRADDNAETVQNRLKTYHDMTEPIADFYAAKGKLVRVTGQDKVEDTTAAVFSALANI